MLYDATQCYLIDSNGSFNGNGSYTRKVLNLLDAFAASQQLEIDHDDPANTVYSEKEGGVVIAKLTYTIGMGRFGSVLALFEFPHRENTNLPQKLSRFVESSLADKFKVTECRRVDGFQIPEIYR